jgi:hypothetical protein
LRGVRKTLLEKASKNPVFGAVSVGSEVIQKKERAVDIPFFFAVLTKD